jgi:hypothetical protein
VIRHTHLLVATSWNASELDARLAENARDAVAQRSDTLDRAAL